MAVSLLNKSSVYTMIEELVLDASIEEQHKFSSKVSQYPVESGATISDNIYNEPIHLSIHGIVSNHPLPNSPNAYRTSQGQTDIRHDVFYYLKRLRDTRQLVSVLTGLDDYTNMAISDISIPVDYRKSEVLEFTISLVQVRIVESKIVPITYLSKKQSTNKQAAPKKDLGKQTPADVDPGSVLFRGANGVAKLTTGSGLLP